VAVGGQTDGIKAARVGAGTAKRGSVAGGFPSAGRARRRTGGRRSPGPLYVTSGLRSRVGEFALCGLQDARAVLVRALVGPDVPGAIVVALGQDGDDLGGGQLVIA
jgi:hypothetical protein